MDNVTIKDIARIAGVSNATVSRALSGSHEVGEETRNRIRRICDELGYTPNTVARSMVMRRTNLIGLIVPSLDNPFMSEIANYAEMRVRERGFNLMVCGTSYQTNLERNAFSLLTGRQVDGILFVPATEESAKLVRPFTAKTPTVYLSDIPSGTDETFVSIDNHLGMYQAVEYLYALGHRKILYLGCRHNSNTHHLRLAGYLDACEKHGIAPEVVYSDFSRSSIQSGYQLGRFRFREKEPCTAILCPSDTLSIGVMRAADEAGLRIPEDISVMGFDDISLSALPRIGLTTVSQPKKELTDVAVDLLLEKITTPSLKARQRLLSPSIVERTSCCMIGSGT